MSEIRPSRRWYWLAFALALAGIAVAITVGVRAVTGFTAPARIDPAGGTVTLKKDGVTVYASASGVQLSCQATSPTGAAVPLEGVVGKEEITVNSITWYAALRSAEPERHGLWDVKCEPPPADIRIAVGPRVSLASIVSGILVAITVAAAAVIIAAVLIIVTFVRRRAARRLPRQT